MFNYAIGTQTRSTIGTSDLNGKTTFKENRITNNPSILETKFPSTDKQDKKGIYIDGQFYEIETVPDDNPLYLSEQPITKQVVIIDGKQYDVQAVKDWKTCDGKKSIVIIDGKEYEVKNQSEITFQQIGDALFNAYKESELNKKLVENIKGSEDNNVVDTLRNATNPNNEQANKLVDYIKGSGNKSATDIIKATTIPSNEQAGKIVEILTSASTADTNPFTS